VQVGIDWSNPLTIGLVSAINPAIKNSSYTGTVTIGFNSFGVVHNGNGSGLLTKSTTSFGSAATILTIANLPNISSIPCGIGTSGAGNQVFILQGGDGGAGIARALIRTTSGGGISSAEIIGGVATALPTAVYVAVYDGTSSLNVYTNGYNSTLSRLNTAASGAMSSMDNFSLGGANRGTDILSASGQNQSLAIAWNRALSAGEVKAISDNPWQIFAPLVT
jgi:hypothetical protein